MAGGRPNMVRADTIDLQDQEAPTAAEHNKQIGSDAIAPHQAAQFQQVQNERRSEEETLADAWNMAGQHGKEQDANGQSDAEAQKKADGNGATNAEGEDGSEDEDDDDDMMDRMSSSPSIEDGASRNFLFIIQLRRPKRDCLHLNTASINPRLSTSRSHLHRTRHRLLRYQGICLRRDRVHPPFNANRYCNRWRIYPLLFIPQKHLP